MGQKLLTYALRVSTGMTNALYGLGNDGEVKEVFLETLSVSHIRLLILPIQDER